MALELKLTHVGTSPKGDIVYLEDGTGVYNDPDNLGGWGAPNPEREDAVLGVFGTLHRTDGDQDVVVEPTIPETDPPLVSQWNGLPVSDGYHEFFMIAIKNGEPTQEGEYGYYNNPADTPNGVAVYKVISLAPVVNIQYVADELDYITAKKIYDDVVNDIPFFGEEDEPRGIYMGDTSLKVPVLSRIAIYRNNLNLELVKLYRQQTDDSGHSREIRDMENNYNYARSTVEGAKYQWAMGNYNETQIIVESFEEVLKDEWKQNY